MRRMRHYLIAALIGFCAFGEGVAQEPGKEPGLIGEPALLQPMCPSRDLCTTAAGATVLVPHQVPTIQKAIDRIATQGTVLVASGAYRENLRIPEGKHIVLKSTGGSKETRLRPRKSGQPTITVEPGATACISRFQRWAGSGDLRGKQREDSGQLLCL